MVALGTGPLQAAGLAEQHVVLSLAGRDVADAAAFAQLATDEHAALATRGGTLRMKVQTTDPTPREFALKVAAPPTPDKPRNGKGRPVPPGPHGGVNIWDKAGDDKGRDDPRN